MLTVVEIRALKPAKRPFKVADPDGLYLLVQPSGALLWRFRYRIFGAERKLSLAASRRSACSRHASSATWRAELIDGIDPSKRSASVG